MTSASHFAIELERGEQRLYHRMANLTDNPAVRNAFEAMASDEHQVINRLADLCTTGEQPACIASAELQVPERTLIDDIQPQWEVKSLQSNIDAYRFALRVEEGIERIYEQAAQQMRDPEVQDALRQVVDIKRESLDELESVYHFTNAPNQYLEWGEFSNPSLFHQFGRDVDL